jgi:hypothetical protein
MKRNVSLHLMRPETPVTVGTIDKKTAFITFDTAEKGSKAALFGLNFYDSATARNIALIINKLADAMDDLKQEPPGVPSCNPNSRLN